MLCDKSRDSRAHPGLEEQQGRVENLFLKVPGRVSRELLSELRLEEEVCPRLARQQNGSPWGRR